MITIQRQNHVWTTIPSHSVREVLFGYGIYKQTSDKSIPEKVQWMTENPGTQLTCMYC